MRGTTPTACSLDMLYHHEIEAELSSAEVGLS